MPDPQYAVDPHALGGPLSLYGRAIRKSPRPQYAVDPRVKLAQGPPSLYGGRTKR